MKITCSNRITYESKVEPRGFTLVELLVVMSIMASVVLVSLQSARDKGRIASGIQQESAIYQRWGTELVGWWKMESLIDAGGGKKCTKNEVTGVCDEVKNEYYGSELSFAAGSIALVDGVNGGNAFDFTNNGTNPFVLIPRTYNLTDFTYSAWIYNKTGGDNVHSILNYFWQLENQALCYYSAKITPEASPNIFRCTDPGTVPDNKWVFIVTSFNGSASPNATLRFYIDGKMSIPSSGSYTNLSGASDDVTRISGYQNSIPRRFFGYMDDVRIYKGAMGVAQIEKLYAEGLAKHSLATSN